MPYEYVTSGRPQAARQCQPQTPTHTGGPVSVHHLPPPVLPLDTEPPQNLAAERGVLGSLLIGAGLEHAFSIVATGLEAEHFYRPAHRALYTAIIDMVNVDEPVDPITLHAWLDLHGWPPGVGAVYLVDLVQAVSAASHAVTYARTIVNLARRRTFQEQLNRAAGRLTGTNPDLGDIAAELDAGIRSLRDGKPDSATAKDPQQTANEAALVRERATVEARRKIADEVADAAWAEPDLGPTRLDNLLATPPRPKQWTIDGLHRTGSNRLLTAQFKTGKTTTVLNEIRSLVDGYPLYERFDVNKIDEGSIVMFNYEVDADQIREWFSELGIRNTQRVHVFNLRGIRMSLVSDRGIDTAVRWLSDVGARYWIIDPYTRALSSCGLSENSNDDVARFTDTLDEIKRRAGVDDLLVASHTGRGEMAAGEERARGATRLDDWADVRHILVRGRDEDHDSRYMWAEGRDVDVPEFRLEFDPECRRLIAEDGSRSEKSGNAILEDVVEAVAANPGTNGNGLVLILPHARARVLKTLKDAERRGRIYGVAGPNKTRFFHLKGTGPGAGGEPSEGPGGSR